MTEQCFGRHQKDGESHRARFADNHRFFLEYRCGGTVSEEKLCKKCLEWKQRGLKKNDHYRSLHGLMTEPIPEWSHIFEGPWYQSKVVAYGHPSAFEMGRAKKAQEDARKGVVAQEVKAVIQEPKVESKAEVKPESKRRSRKKPGEPVPLPPPPPEPEPTPDPPAPTPPKPAAKRSSKKKETPSILSPVAVKPVVSVQAVETSSLPSEVEIVKIVVRHFFANDTHYFRDPVKNKLYGVGNDKRPTKYIGRWDPESETIDTEFPDSDVE
jgi:hypothetical protein